MGRPGDGRHRKHTELGHIRPVSDRGSQSASSLTLRPTGEPVRDEGGPIAEVSARIAGLVVALSGREWKSARARTADRRSTAQT